MNTDAQKYKLKVNRVTREEDLVIAAYEDIYHVYFHHLYPNFSFWFTIHTHIHYSYCSKVSQRVFLWRKGVTF